MPAVNMPSLLQLASRAEISYDVLYDWFGKWLTASATSLSVGNFSANLTRAFNSPWPDHSCPNQKLERRQRYSFLLAQSDDRPLVLHLSTYRRVDDR